MRDFTGYLLLSNYEIADALNTFFHSVFTTDDNYVPFFNQRTNTNMDVPTFNPDEVRAAIHASKNSNACGPDGCSSKFIKLFPRIVHSFM